MAPSANYFSVGFNATPYHQVFSRSGDTFSAFGSPAAVLYGDSGGFSADGRFLAFRDSGGIRVFRITGTGLTLLETISCSGRGYDTKFSPDGRYLLTVDSSGAPYAKLFNGMHKTPIISTDSSAVQVATSYVRTGL
ncbi:hypothetical protein H3H36_10790 [Duganella sp. FT3S]|uniref:Uncharacterized protein n=1 Tax=Rugamonas fusca TaxID=2758568 RepID=A0A7W2EHE5_9BURK|nr:hypothetical protein [Rugamonas fusca]